MTINITAEPMAPLNETTEPMQLALLVLLDGPLLLHAGVNEWRPAMPGRLAIAVKPATVEALLRREAVWLGRAKHDGKSWQVAKLTPNGAWRARTVKRKRAAEAEQIALRACPLRDNQQVPRMLTPSIQPRLRANDA